MAAVYSEGTVKGVEPEKFDAEDAAKKLQKAMKGLGTDEKAIIHILGDHNNLQRQMIKDKFKAMFGKDLVEDLKGELGGHFLTLALYLLMPARYFDAYCLHSAMNRMGTKENSLIDILVSRSAMELTEMKEYYKKELFQREAEEDLVAEVAGDLKHVLVGLLQGQRTEDQTVDDELVAKDVSELREAGVKNFIGTDESVFNRILVVRSVPHLRKVLEKYAEAGGKDIEEDIESEMSGDTRDAFIALVRWVKDPVKYFASCFHETFAGPGTDDERLMQLVVSHCEVDLKDIGDAYNKEYKKGLPVAIMNETMGDYQKLLIRLANPK